MYIVYIARRSMTYVWNDLKWTMSHSLTFCFGEILFEELTKEIQTRIWSDLRRKAGLSIKVYVSTPEKLLRGLDVTKETARRHWNYWNASYGELHTILLRTIEGRHRRRIQFFFILKIWRSLFGKDQNQY